MNSLPGDDHHIRYGGIQFGNPLDLVCVTHYDGNGLMKQISFQNWTLLFW